MSEQIQPVFILPEDTQRTKGKDAQRINVAAARAVADAVRTTLGPKGMDKMLVDAAGDVTVTNDGVTILEEMQIEHPAAKMVVDIARTQENVVGDGTTTAVVLAGELLKQAEILLDQRIHPTLLTKGYRLAEKECQRVLNEIATTVTLDDPVLLQQIAVTAMTGKGTEANREHLANLVVEAVQQISQQSSLASLQRDDVKVMALVGERAEKTNLVKGIVLEKERVHSEMPIIVEQARIALLNTPLEIRNTEIDAKIQITSPDQLDAFLDKEEQTLKQIVAHVQATGTTVLCCQKGIDDVAQHFLAKAGILALRRVSKSDMERLAKVTGSKIVNSWKELTPQDLGSAGRVAERKIGTEQFIFVEQCPQAKVVTLLVRGGTIHIAEEVKRAVIDAVGDVITTVKESKVVAGAGAVEVSLAKSINSYAQTLQGREQLAVQAFASSLEIVPKTLAENAGLDAIDMLTALRVAHDQGQRHAGLDVVSGKVIDAWQAGVLEPLKIKTTALASAMEVVELLLRIDDVLLAGKASSPQGYPPMGM